jgi:hypothetical protein
MTNSKIPKNYRLIADSDLRSSRCRIYMNKEDSTFFLLVDEDEEIGPLTRHQIEALNHAASDVLSWKGAIFFLE